MCILLVVDPGSFIFIVFVKQLLNITGLFSSMYSFIKHFPLEPRSWPIVKIKKKRKKIQIIFNQYRHSYFATPCLWLRSTLNFSVSLRLPAILILNLTPQKIKRVGIVPWSTAIVHWSVHYRYLSTNWPRQSSSAPGSSY